VERVTDDLSAPSDAPSGSPHATPEAAPVEICFLSFTEITDPAGHRAYNVWHQLDHMPEQYTLSGVRWGQRWVRTPACRAATHTTGGAFGAVHYVTCYLMAAPVAPVLEQFRDLAVDLRRRGRFFDARRSVLSGPLTVTGAWAADRVQVSAASIPFRPNLGVHVTLWEEPPTAAGLGAAAPVADLLAIHGVAGVWDLAALPVDNGINYSTDRHVVRLCYLDAPPLSVTPALDAVTEAHAGALGVAPSFAGPFEAITPWKWDWFDEESPASG
jgi:hypothetical protein